MARRRSQGPRRALRLARRWIRASAANALEVVRLGRLGPAYHAPFDVLEQDPMFRLRRYLPASGALSASTRPVVLVPPLMLTAEIYDVSPELSAAAFLVARGVDTWVVDFGAPEREAGGMTRTLDDHVRAVSRAIDRVRAVTGRDVHLAGYSQGGMFAYQVAAFRRSEGVASLVTFGSPVDIHRSVPRVSSDVVGVLARAARPFIVPIVEHIEGLPGILTSTGFKLLTPRKEIEQLVDFVRKLNDRKALEKRESRRRFLGGEGFVAWPGPALRTFLDEFIVHNRMLSGGMVIEGRTVTLADITCPVLAVIGSRDTFARPDAARAIVAAAPRADVRFLSIDAGHFGLVVGSRALHETWPTVAAWARWVDGDAALPALLAAPTPARNVDDEPEEAAFDVEIDLAVDFLTNAFERAVHRASDWVRDASDSAASLRYQVPRLAELERITPHTQVGPSRALAEQARRIPERTFFLWNGRAFSYADADARVNHVVRGFIACGVRPKDRVLVVMAGRPSFLSAVTALGRLGAVPIVVPPNATSRELASVIDRAKPRCMVADPERARDALSLGLEVLVLGGGGRTRDLGPGLVDMEAIDPAKVELPPDFQPDAGRAGDPALIFSARGRGNEVSLAPITHHRWALSAIGAAAACTLRPDDTVYCCLPLDHPAGLLVSVGSALASGARLALAPEFDAATFWSDVRRYGATVAFYAGEMLRPLVDADVTPHDRHHPLRLFAGSGMRADLWRRIGERFGTGVLEFYAATTQNLVLANASGAKVGAIGRPLPGSTDLEIVRFDLTRRTPRRDENGWIQRASVDEPGLGIARLPRGASDDGPRVFHDVFEPGDAWFASQDLLRRDDDGDIWFVDRVNGMVETRAGFVSIRRIEDALYRLPEIQLAACLGNLVAFVVSRAPLDASRISRAPSERPKLIHRVATMPMTAGFQPDKLALETASPEILETLRLEEEESSDDFKHPSASG